MAIIVRTGKKLVPSQLSALIVDDQPFYRNLLSEICKSMGLRNIATAVDGEDALEAVTNLRPSLVICDWIMPQMDGLIFTQKLRRLRDEKLAMTPVIMVTSNNLMSQIQEARGCGVDTFVLKPASVKSVFDRVREVVEQPRPFINNDDYIGPCRRRNRNSDNYVGQFRRFDDPFRTGDDVIDERRAKDKMAAQATKIKSLLLDLHRGKLSNIKEIATATFEVLQMANTINDTYLAKVCWSLTAYIDKCNNKTAARTDIIATHLEAIDVLIKTPNSQEQAREEVANGLHKMVLSALRAA